MFDALIQERLIDRKVGERMRLSVGFRNIAVHNYESIDWQIVYAMCTTHMADFTDFAKVVYQALPEGGDDRAGDGDQAR